MRAFALLSWTSLLVATVAAAPSKRMQRRRSPQAIPQGLPINATTTSEPAIFTEDVDPDLVIQYAVGDSGAIIYTTDVTSVTAILTIPTFTKPPKGVSSATYDHAVWVGIDGDASASSPCEKVLFQAGVDCSVTNGVSSCVIWSEWYPNDPIVFTSLGGAVAGDEIKVTVTASSDTAGVATAEHVKLGTSESHSYSGESTPLCRASADWVVESHPPLPEFASWVFSSASYTAGGTKSGIIDAELIDMWSSTDVTESTCVINSSSELTCTWITSDL